MRTTVGIGTLACCILQWLASLGEAASIADVYNLHSQLLLNYSRNIRPINDQRMAIEVKVGMYMKSIQDFDEVNEKFSFIAALFVTWKDESMVWNPHLYNGLSETTVSYDDVWVPELTLSSPSSRTPSMGRTSDRIRIHHSGTCEWIPANLIESTCSVNVKNYPFDTQSCTTAFVSLGYKNYEVKLKKLHSSVQMEVYSPNALWDITGSEVAASTLGSGSESQVLFTMSLKRKSSFVVINVILPIFFLSILNVLVFILVPESGERIGYCITTLLAIAVYMTIVSDMLPQNSEPIPLISYKLMIDMLISSSIVFVTIINMRFWNREDDENVPRYLKSMYRTLTCRSCRRKKVVQDDSKNSSNKVEVISIDKHFDEKLEKFNHNEAGVNDDNITWKRISHVFDMVALVFFTSLSVISCVAYIIVSKLSSL